LQWKIQTETQRPGIQASHENCITLKPLPITGGLHIEETFEISACMGADRVIDEPSAAVFIDEGAVDGKGRAIPLFSRQARWRREHVLLGQLRGNRQPDQIRGAAGAQLLLDANRIIRNGLL
jgi:hypothetical protein